MSGRTLRLAAMLIASVAAGWLLSRRLVRPRRPAPPLFADARVAHVPHVQGTITLDGDTDDSGWLGPTLRTGKFVGSDGTTPVHPESEARLVWGDGFLYLNLYAADEDIHATAKGPDGVTAEEDSFHLELSDGAATRVIDVNPLGVVSDAIRPAGSPAPADLAWSSQVHVSHELDGTPNRSDDHDEEWVIEMAIPFESLGLRGAPGERVALSLRRCDTPFGGTRVCGAWGEGARRTVLVLD